MRVVIAQMKHETNTFSPVPTPLARFAGDTPEPLTGADAYQAAKGTGSALAAFIELAEEAGAEIVLPVAGNAWPSGPVEDEAFDAMAARIVAAVADGCDAVLLDLHGAMVTRSFDDGEGELLRRIRAVAPHVPIGVALDMHANVFPEMAARVDVLAGYQTYPHVDMFDTGLRAGRAIFSMLAGRARPALAWGARAMLPHVMRQSSLDSPNRELQARCREMEQQGALCASVWVGFPNADVPHAGLSAAVVTDGDPERARRWCDELLDRAWGVREAFVYTPEPLAASIERARALRAERADRPGPIVLLDHSDNCASGGTMDVTAVLRALIEARLGDGDRAAADGGMAAFAIWDPGAVQQMMHAGVGAELRLSLGGKSALPALGLEGVPLECTGRVRMLADGRYRNAGPMARGEVNHMGPTAVFETGGWQVVVLSRHVEPHDLAAFRAVGIEPERLRYLLLKSRVHWRAGLGDLAAGVVECAGPGVCTSDYSALPFERIRRPMYPLDPM